MIDIRPSCVKDTGLEHTTILHGPVAAVHMIYRLEQRTVKMHGDECRNRVQWNTYPRIIEIEGIINPLEQTDIDIHPLYWPVARVVDGTRMA